MSNATQFLKKFCLFVCLAAAIVSCKKDDDPVSIFAVTGSTDYAFEYGQTREIPFYQTNIKEFEVEKQPSGWQTEVENSVIRITAPQVGTSADLVGRIVVVATSYDLITIRQTLVVAVQTAEDLSAEATANCYLVSEPNGRYKFRATVKGNESASSITPSDAEIVWQYPAGLLDKVSLEEGYIFFSADSTLEITEGNAVIAALDDEENILWSWHIWSTAYDPEQGAQTYSNGLTFMDRNLGAAGNSNATENDILLSYGLLYQWGRKDPFVGPRYYDTSADRSIYDANGKWLSVKIVASTEETGTIDYATANPLTVITGSEKTEFDWLYASRNDALWGNPNSSTGVNTAKGSKSLYDPCPIGWQVAPQNGWEGFVTETGDQDLIQAEGSYDYGWDFLYDGSETTRYPSAGRRSFSKGVFTNVDLEGYDPVGFYWSNSAYASGSSMASALSFTKDLVEPVSSQYRAGAFSIRCVKQ